MNRGIFKSIMGTIDSCPYAPRSKEIPLAALAPFAGPAATVLGGVVNSLFGSSSNSKTNETNLEIARMNNEQQYKMFHEQMDYNYDMWNKQNAYNDPSAQVQRLLAAGINPATVFGNGAISQAGQLTSPNAPQLQQARMNPYQPDLKVGDAVNAFMQSQLINSQRKKMDAETKHTEQLTLFDMKSMESRLKSLNAMAGREDALGELARSELRYVQDSYYWRLKSLRNDIVSQEDQHRLTQEQIYNHRLQNGLAEVQLAYAPRLNEAQLKQYYATVNQIKAQIGLINANTMLTEEQRKHEIVKKAGTIIQNGLSGLDFENKQKTQDAMVDMIMNQADQQYYDAGNAAKFFYGGEVGRRAPLSGFMDIDRYNHRVTLHYRPYQGR